MNAQALCLNGQAILYSPPGTGTALPKVPAPLSTPLGDPCGTHQLILAGIFLLITLGALLLLWWEKR